MIAGCMKIRFQVIDTISFDELLVFGKKENLIELSC